MQLKMAYIPAKSRSVVHVFVVLVLISATTQTSGAAKLNSTSIISGGAAKPDYCTSRCELELNSKIKEINGQILKLETTLENLVSQKMESQDVQEGTSLKDHIVKQYSMDLDALFAKRGWNNKEVSPEWISQQVAGSFRQAWHDPPSGQPGEKGAAGDKGPAGDKGSVGDKGAVGESGIKGPYGDKGAKGDQGESGLRGEQGLPGMKGRRGAKGSRCDPIYTEHGILMDPSCLYPPRNYGYGHAHYQAPVYPPFAQTKQARDQQYNF